MCPTPYLDLGADTFIFVDVDGVLNVGIRDQDDAPLLYNQSNKDFALCNRGRKQSRAHDEECVQKLLAVTERELPDGSEGTFGDLACSHGTHISEVLSKRLAEIISAAGEGCTVVLSSNWRKSHHHSRVRKLEALVSKHLGCTFTFDARTKLAEERYATDRLRCVGDYVEALCGPQGKYRDGRPLKILMLDDFFITPLNGWTCGSSRIDSTAAAEAYLKSRAPRGNISAKLIHCYHEFTSQSGLNIQLGSGLTEQQTAEAANFVREPSRRLGAIAMLQKDMLSSENSGKFSVRKSPNRSPVTSRKCSKSSNTSDAKLPDYISAALPWLSMYLPCAV